MHGDMQLMRNVKICMLGDFEYFENNQKPVRHIPASQLNAP